MTSQEILSQLQAELNWFDESSVITATDEVVEIHVASGDTVFNVWWRKGMGYGFDLLAGGVKVYATLEELIKMFRVYTYINGVFLPDCKAVALEFERYISLNLVFKKTSGNTKTGFVAHFNCLGSDSEVRIVAIKGDFIKYHAELVDYNADESYEVLASQDYTFDEETGSVITLWTLEDYEEELIQQYGSSDEYDIDKKAIGIYSVTTKTGLSYTYNVSLSRNIFIITVTEICGTQVSERVDMENVVDLGYLSEYVKTLYDAMSEPVLSDVQFVEDSEVSFDEPDMPVDKGEASLMPMEKSLVEEVEVQSDSSDIDVFGSDLEESVELNDNTSENAEPTSEEAESAFENAESTSEEAESVSEEAEPASENAEPASEEAESVDEAVIVDAVDEEEPTEEEPIEEDTEEPESALEHNAEAIEEADEEAAEGISEEVFEESIEETTVEKDEVETKQETTPAEEVVLDFCVCLLVDDEDNHLGVEVLIEDGLYFINKDKFETSGFPIEIFTEKDRKIKNTYGIRLTSLERKAHKAMKDISNDDKADAVLAKLMEMMFS